MKTCFEEALEPYKSRKLMILRTMGNYEVLHDTQS